MHIKKGGIRMDTKSTEKRLYDIVAGPSKAMLFDACKYAYAKTAKLPVDFTIAIRYTLPTKHNPQSTFVQMAITDIKICGIEHEDGSGESFNLHGYCKADTSPFAKTSPAYKAYRFKAYYNSKSRKGNISLIDIEY